jgi:hypothetical protein
MLAPTLRSTFYHKLQKREVRILDYIRPLDELRSPILSGLLSMAARSLPHDHVGAIQQELEEGISKEVQAAVEEFRPVHFDWDPILSEDKSFRNNPIAEGYPANGQVHEEIFRRLKVSLRRLSGSLLYPDYSKKTLGQGAVVNMSPFVKKYYAEEEREMYTTLGLERIYHEFGFWFRGFTEVRWAWKFNDLKPRVYYARGPDQYRWSRFIQAVFNVFVDAFPNTHRFQRFQTFQIVGKPLQTCFIYDYSSFTSTLQEVTDFTLRLAEFCRGTIVTVVDSREGLIDVDLGDMLKDYSTHCVEYPKFDLSKVSGMPPGECVGVHTCGMLGVPGNISSCTLLHGIHLSIVLSSLLNNKAVGDDALGWKELQNNIEKRCLLRHLSGIGKLSFSKMVFWDPEDEDADPDQTTWNYVKRPAVRLGNRLVSRDQAVWPSVSVVLSIPDGIHTIFPPETEYLRLKKTCNMLLSFVLQFEFFAVSEEESIVIDRYVRHILKIGQIEKRLKSLGLHEMIYPRGFRTSDVKRDMVEDYWNSVVRLPIEFHPNMVEDFDVFKVMRGAMSPGWKLAKDLGYAEIEPCFERYLVRDAEDLFLKYLSKMIRGACDFRIVKKLPDFLESLIRSEYLATNPYPYVDPEEYSSDEDL